MNVPFGAMSGFSLHDEIRYVAAYYGVKPRSLRRRDPRHSVQISEARQALYWQLTTRRGLTPQRAGELLGIAAETVRDGATRHARRISEFIATAGQPASIEGAKA
jgi:hypothetical protein